MHQLGQTRSALRPDHLLQTPDTFVRTPWPGLRKGVVIVHVSSAAGARFTEYTAEFEESGSLAPTGEQRFVFVFDGQAEIDGVCLTPGGYAYLPPGHAASVSARTPARAVVIEKPRTSSSVAPPAFFTGHESNIAASPLADDESLMVRSLLPDEPSFDFAVNTMTYLPGAALPMVEVHVMEHGLLMLEGGGIYRLGDCWYQAAAGDFIWMAPFCPQWFGALGRTPAKYLIYKNWQRGLFE
jgi:(S)-ureidoglycine aminohydrolase